MPDYLCQSVESVVPTAIIPETAMIPPGSFWMGGNVADKFANDTERPRRRVELSASFLLGAKPVTVGEFRRFRPDHDPGDPPDWPVVNASWRDAGAYCAWMSETTGLRWRLPSEAEWEYAARAGSETPYPWGDDITTAQANYYYSESGARIGPGRRTVPGECPPNAWGVFDMPGNVNEWVADAWHPNYAGAPADAAPWTEGAEHGLRVLRGGAWDYLPRLLRVSWRDALPEQTRRDNTGFRVMREL